MQLLGVKVLAEVPRIATPNGVAKAKKWKVGLISSLSAMGIAYVFFLYFVYAHQGFVLRSWILLCRSLIKNMSLNISVLEEIQKLQKNGENGVLTLSRTGEHLAISYRDGIIQSVSSNRDTHLLGAYLEREGLLKNKDV